MDFKIFLKWMRSAYELAAEESLDPITKNGAILLDSEFQEIGRGANCLPRGVQAFPNRLERPDKYSYLIHAEQNAISDAARRGNRTLESILICPWAACTSCARLIIQAGVKKLVTHGPLMQKSHMKWPGEIELAQGMLDEAKVECVRIPENLGGIKHMFNGTLWTP